MESSVFFRLPAKRCRLLGGTYVRHKVLRPDDEKIGITGFHFQKIVI